MSKESDGFAKGLVFGAIIGGAVGAITALLFAPKPGVELRKDLAEKSSEIYDRTSNYISNMESKVGTVLSEKVNEGKIKAQNIIEGAKKQAEELLINAESVLKDARSKAVSAKDGLTDKFGTLKDAAKASADAFKNEMNSKEDGQY